MPTTFINYSFWNRKRLPIIRQSDRVECGLACIAMIANFHGAKYTLSNLRLRFPPSLLGSKMSTLASIASELSFSARGVSLQFSELGLLKTPCILHWQEGHYVVLSEVKKNCIEIVDPSHGREFVTNGCALSLFSGSALEMIPRQAFQESKSVSQRDAPVDWIKLAGKVPGFNSALCKSFVLAAFLEIASILQPLLGQMVIDATGHGVDREFFIICGCILVILTVISSLLSASRSWTIAFIQNHLFASTASNIFSHLLSLPASFFERRRLGDVISRFNTIGSIQQVLSTRLVEVMLDGIMGFVTFGLILSYSVKISLLSGLTLLMLLIFKKLTFGASAEANGNKLAMHARQQNSIVEGIRLAQTIRLHNAQSAIRGRFDNVNVELVNSSMNVQRSDIFVQFFVDSLAGCERVLVLVWGSFLVLGGELTIGALFAITFLTAQFSARSRSFIEYIVQLRLLRLQQGRLADIVEARSERNLSTLFAGTPGSYSLHLEAISFQYSTQDKWLLRNFSLQIPDGQFLAITGASGSGKSTLIKLLMGVITPSAGTIYVGGVQLELLGKLRHRSAIGISSVETELFAGTIADNISIFDTEMQMSRLVEVASTVGIHEEVLTMPMGYNTRIGGVDGHLSAGQKQRILLARALYLRPKILILDEATCHIDQDGERLIINNLRSLGITRIMVTHRLAAAQFADRIFDLTACNYVLQKEDSNVAVLCK